MYSYGYFLVDYLVFMSNSFTSFFSFLPMPGDCLLFFCLLSLYLSLSFLLLCLFMIYLMIFLLPANAFMCLRFRSFTTVRMPGLFVFCLYLCILLLCFCLVYPLSICAWVFCYYICAWFIRCFCFWVPELLLFPQCVNAIGFFFEIYNISFNQRHLYKVQILLIYIAISLPRLFFL